MKQILTAALLFTALMFTGCQGDPGPMGPPGIDGNDGGIIVSSAYEIQIDFNSGNNYEHIEPYGFDVYPYDVVLVYIVWETDNGQEIWRPLPQTVNFDDGDLVYNFDFTQDDVRFFLDGTTDFGSLDSSWTQGQIFRVVVVPADNVDGIDTSNLNEVMKAVNIQSFNLK